MKYAVLFTKSAIKDLLEIPNADVARILEKIDHLTDNPRPTGSKKLKGSMDLFWRIRVGNYRVIYTIEDIIKVVDIIAIGNRKDIY